MSSNEQREAQLRAMAILNNEERAALALQYNHNKSTWQAGEILQKAHYKYLELKTRAEKFLKMLCEHFLIYDSLIPEYVELDTDFILYLKLCIEQRLTIKQVCERLDNDLYLKTSTRDVEIIANMQTLQNSKSPHYQNLYTLIHEFDRYNNFRILPRDIQEPSAFKRRNKGRYKKHLQISTSFNDYTFSRIIDIFQVSKKAAIPGYLVLIKRLKVEDSKIILINANEKNLAVLSRASLYVFPTLEQAERFTEEITTYFFTEKKDPRMGLKFWPNFRNLIKLAYNFDQINNIAPTRKGLVPVLQDMDDKYMLRLKRELKAANN